MKKVKIAFWIIVFGFVGLIIFQNRAFFMSDNQLVLDLGVFYYETPFMANAIFFVAFFLVGVLISYFFGLFRHFKDAKTIKTLKAKETSLVETVASLEKQLTVDKAAVEPVPVEVPVEEQPVAEQPVETAVEAK